MVTATQRARLVPRPRTTSRPPAIPVVVALALVVTVLALVRPQYILAGIIAVAVGVALLWRVEWVALLYVAIEPFGDYLKSVSPMSVKLVGALLFLGWIGRLFVRTRPVALRHGSVTMAGVLCLVVLASTVVHANGAVGVEVLTRYLSYLAAFVVLADLMRNGLPPRRVAAAYVISCAGAAAVGLHNYLSSTGDGRAAGPTSDPNDFAFFLVAAIPFAIMLAGRGARFRLFYAGTTVIITVTMLATFSRGGILGLMAVLVYALVARMIRIRTLVAAGVAVAVAVLIVVSVAPDIVTRSLQAKEHVAGANISSRFTTWRMAAEMTADNPALGTGPGGFRTNWNAYIGTTISNGHLDVAHQMYLDVASELGLLGLGSFLGMIALGVVGARRAVRRPDADVAMARATLASFAAVLLAANFLSEQYYLPVWLLCAFGAALDHPPFTARPRTASPTLAEGAA